MLKNFLPIIADVLALAVVMLPLLLVYLQTVRYWRGEAYRTGQKWIIMLFALYLLAVCSVVGIPSIKYIHLDSSLNLLPLLDIVDNPPGYIKNTILNIILFVPLGIFLPAVWPQYRSLRQIAAAGFGFSLSIELLQLFSWRLTDVDDLLTNTLGAVLGFYLFSWLYFVVKKQQFTETAQDGSKDAWLIWAACLLMTIFVYPFLPEPLRNWFLYTPFWQ